MPKKTAKLKIWRLGNRQLLISCIGFCLAMVAVLCGMFWEPMFQQILTKEFVLGPDSRAYDKWKSPPIKLSLDVYFFNWTNPQDIKDPTKKPIMQQLGPYRFTEVPDKVDIVWHPENASVSYRKKSDFFFDVEGSTGSLNDIITTLNPIALSAASKARHWSMVRQNMVDVGLKLYSQEISVSKTVDELLFTGYSDDMIDMARAMPIFGSDVHVPFDKFGWFYTRNGSAELTGYFNVFTGADDMSKWGQMHQWNFKTNSGFFEGQCGEIKGSAGEFQPPNLPINGTVELFSPDMCRPIPLEYVSTEEIEGVEGYKYVGGQRSIDNGSLYEENLCYCNGECVPSGVMNISSCRFDSPVFMSYPHFFNADPFYTNQVVGMSPSAEKHEFYMIIHPITGIALEVAARLQVNMMVKPIGDIDLYSGVPRTFLPLIWFEQKVRITPDLASDLKMLPLMLLVGQIFAGICFSIGILMFCWYPLQNLCDRKGIYGEVEMKKKSQQSLNLTTIQLENGKLGKSTLSVKEKSTPDGSPLLKKAPKIALLPKSETIDSVKTNDTITISVKSND